MLLIFFLQYENNSYSLDSIYKSNNGVLNSLGAPYNYIIMPSPGLFFLSSPFADGIVLLFFNNNCIILDRIINYSPIINMNLLDDNKNMKFVPFFLFIYYSLKTFHIIFIHIY